MQRKIYKDLGLNEEVTIKVPAALVLAATNAYAEAEWASSAVSQFLIVAQEQIMDPIYWNEQQAAHQQAHDQAAEFHNHIMARMFPDDPRLEQ